MPAPLSIPCTQSIHGCDCTLDPVSNYSSEDPDHEVFYGHYDAPPINGTFFAPACLGVCESTESQEAADQCAAAAAVDCSLAGSPRTGNPWPHGAPPPRLRSSVQECAAECGDGNSTTVVEPFGTVVSYTQADADARAHALACKRAKELLVCFVTESPIAPGNVDTFVSVPIVATGGNGDYLFTLSSGALPPGIALDDVGLLSGTPTLAGTYNFTLRVDDSGGATAVRPYQWVISSPVCQGIPTEFADLVWTVDPGIDANFSIAQAAGAFSLAVNPGGLIYEADAPFCNPGALYNVTVTIPYTYNLVGSGASFSIQVWALNVTQGTYEAIQVIPPFGAPLNGSGTLVATIPMTGPHPMPTNAPNAIFIRVAVGTGFVGVSAQLSGTILLTRP